MALAAVTATFGNHNSGLEVGQNSGTINFTSGTVLYSKKMLHRPYCLG